MIETITNVFNSFLQTIYKYLPGSPFRYFIDLVENVPYLQYLNWFLPIAEMITVLEAWVTVVALYYAYSAVLRFIRLIG